MITTKSNFGQMPRTFGGLMEDIFQNGFQNLMIEDVWKETAPIPVNVQETENAFELHVMAPGFNKDEFKLNVEKNVLHISYEHKEEQSEEKSKWLRKEYKMQTFKRSFSLNDKINVAGITAKYNDGILNITLPKKENEVVTAQEIKIS